MSTAHRFMFRDKVFIIRKLTSFSQGLNSRFLLFPRIQTYWLQSAHHLQFNDTQDEKKQEKEEKKRGKKGRKRKEKEEEKRRRKKKEDGHCYSGGTFKVIKHSEPSSASARDVRTAGEKKYVRQRISNNH